MSSKGRFGMAAAVGLFGGSALMMHSPEAVQDGPVMPETAASRAYIDLDRPELPENIGRIAAATVEIAAPFENIHYTEESGKDRGVVTFLSYGSGTVISDGSEKVVVTAAHVVAGLNDSCSRETISYPKTEGNSDAFTSKVESQSPVANLDQKGYVPTYNQGLDATVLDPGDIGALSGIPSLEVRHKVVLEPGDNVFGLGYGPRDKELGFNPNPLSEDSIIAQPQIIAGTVLSAKHGDVAFVEGIAGYAKSAADDEARPGDSGGTVVDANGRYVGDLVAGLSTRTGSQIEKEYSVDMPDSKEDELFNIGVAHIVEKISLDAMRQVARPCQGASALPVTEKKVADGVNVGQLPYSYKSLE